jgi:nitroimidazol reductase NimA-like FMN-containing flavoprotein (pyridoxamine 5'-phosphate oxidase superfamily)
MSQNLYAQFTGVPMAEDDIEALLEAQGYGIISLCADGEPYSIPVSFGYDGESVYFPFLVDDADATKTRFIEDGGTARLLVTDVRGRYDWQSVSITGTVRSVDPDADEWDHFLDTLVDNGWFMRGFERADSIETVQGWKLEQDERRGLERTEQPAE